MHDEHTGQGSADDAVLVRLDRGDDVAHAAAAGRVQAGEERALSDDDMPAPDAGRFEADQVEYLVLKVGDAAAVRDLIVERREWAEAKAQRYERLRNRILDGLSEEEFLATAPRVGPYLTLMRGISFEEENLRWAKRALAIVEQRQGARSVR